MKIIEAVWEKRNINMDSYEIIIEQEDLNNIEKNINTIKEQNFKDCYVIVKAPSANLRIIHELENIGYNFMECQHEIILKTLNYEIPRTLDRLASTFEIEYIEKTPEKWKSVINLITDELFTTDRIYLDKTLPMGTSARRYKNWVDDLYSNENAWAAIIKKGDEPYMFNICIDNKKEESTNYMLAGAVEKYKNSGFGSILPIPTIKHAINNGFKIIETSISSNNLAVLRLYEYYGFSTQNIKYVLRKIY